MASFTRTKVKAKNLKSMSVSSLKVLESYFSIYFLMQKPILYAKIAKSPKKFFSKISFKYYIGLLFS